MNLSLSSSILATYESDKQACLYRDVGGLVVCQQGPPPPNPLVVERFQQVISQLFQQARAHSLRAAGLQFSQTAVPIPKTEEC